MMLRYSDISRFKYDPLPLPKKCICIALYTSFVTNLTHFRTREKFTTSDMQGNRSDLVKNHLSIITTLSDSYIMECLTFNPPVPSKYGLQDSVH
jgi:hypothetical protein